MHNNDLDDLVLQLVKLRELTSKNLPIGHSFIPYDILLAVMQASILNSPLTVKALFTALPYSDMGLRYHLRKLIAARWIELKPSLNDKRNKELVPTNKLWNAFQSISNTHPISKYNI